MERKIVGLVLLALSLIAVQRAFLSIDAANPRPRPQTPSLRQGPQMRASALGAEWSSLAAASGAALAAGAVLALRSRSREDSSTTMFGGHDRKTFRGKLHAGSFGKHRLRPEKRRKIKLIKNGTYDPSRFRAKGALEPEHPWDMENLMKNPKLGL